VTVAPHKGNILPPKTLAGDLLHFASRSLHATGINTVFALTLLSVPAMAQDSLLAEYWANSGSLPPEYAWDVTVTVSSEGLLVLKHCKGYETEGPACKTRKATVSPATLAAITAAAEAAGLAESPARQVEDVPVGGSAAGGAVWLDGTRYLLPAWPVEEDAARVGSVLAAVAAAIPARLQNRFLKGN
jgi:hypothetical protein